MIYIKDDFLEQRLLDAILLDKREYQEVKTPGKSFWVKEPSSLLVDYMVNKISYIENRHIENILCFFRQAKEGQDDDWRIHNDTIIQGQQPEKALVLYISKEIKDKLNGTAFWSHKDIGDMYPGGSVDDFNNLLTEDANDVSKWDLKSVIGHKQNRLISYPCNYFHSKYPNEFKENREVLVMFYKTKKINGPYDIKQKTFKNFKSAAGKIIGNARIKNNTYERIEANRNEKQTGCGCESDSAST